MIDIKFAKKRFRQHKENSRKRGIPFIFTFEEWIKVWLESGHWNERGRRRGQYVMSRFGDKGPYTINNVEIILTDDNLSIKLSDKSRLLRSIKMKGNKHTLGFKHSTETKYKLSEGRKGRKLSNETRAKMGQAHKGISIKDETKLKISNALKGKSKKTRIYRKNEKY